MGQGSNWLPGEHGRSIGLSVARSCIASQSSHPVGIVGNRGLIGGLRGSAGGQPWGDLGLVGVSGLLWRVNNQATTYTPSGNRGNSRPTPAPNTSHPRPSPCPALAYLLCTQVRGRPNPLVSLAVQLAIGQTGPPWTRQGQQQGRQDHPRGGVPEPRRVCVSHSHFWAKIVTPSSPQVHHCPPPSPHLPPTTHTWLIKVNRGCAKVSIGCLAVGLYVPASAVQKTIGDYR